MIALRCLTILALAVLLPASLPAEPDKPQPEDRPVAATPEEAWTQFQKAVESKDRERIWSLLSKDSREMLEKEIGSEMKGLEGKEAEEMAEEFGITVEEYSKMSEKDLILTRILVSAARDKNTLLKMKMQDIKVDGDKAEGRRDESGDGKDLRPAYFLKEDGEWKLDAKREMERKEEPPPDDAPQEPEEEKK